jgi:hypothetical protein
VGVESTFEASCEEREALAVAWPRPLIADGSAMGLAAWWVESRRQADSLGLPRIARHRLDPGVEAGLFDVRRARRITRGLEAAESLLTAEETGIKKAAGSQADLGRVRISRLLIVSRDGSERFYRQVAKLHARFANRLEVLLLDCDEEALGAAAFGPGRRARALLLHHKDAVIRFLSLLDLDTREGEAGDSPGAES